MVNKTGKGQFSSDNQPKGRGRSTKTLLFEAIREESLIGLKKDSTKEDAEKAYLTHIARRAFDSEDQASATLLSKLLDKTYSSIKATMPTYEFEFTPDAKPLDKVTQIMTASSEGQIPPDVAAIFVQCIKACVDIEEFTDLKERLEKLEAMINGE